MDNELPGLALGPEPLEIKPDVHRPQFKEAQLRFDRLRLEMELHPLRVGLHNTGLRHQRDDAGLMGANWELTGSNAGFSFILCASVPCSASSQRSRSPPA